MSDTSVTDEFPTTLFDDLAGNFPTHFNGGSSPIPLLGGAITETIACFVRGTLIATPTGDMPVEAIEPGILVSLARGGASPVRWIGRRRLRPAASRDPASVQPVAVAPGALGDGVPNRELRLSPEHAVFIGGLLVPVGLLVNGRSIVRLDVDAVEYFHVELDGHDVILAEGAPAESYLDTGNRSIFANTPLVALHPRFEPSLPCAEMMFDGAWLHALRARLARIADADRGGGRATA